MGLFDLIGELILVPIKIPLAVAQDVVNGETEETKQAVKDLTDSVKR